MSNNELYNLQWNDFQTTLSGAMGSLLEDSDFIDVTVACDGQSFGAHKVVLSACSSYFKKLLKVSLSIFLSYEIVSLHL